MHPYIHTRHLVTPRIKCASKVGKLTAPTLPNYVSREKFYNMFGQEDLFNIAQQTVNTIVIRYGDKTKQRFDSSNKLIPFDKLVETISNGV